MTSLVRFGRAACGIATEFPTPVEPSCSQSSTAFRAAGAIVYNELMSADKNDRNRQVAELEAHAAQMEQQIEAAEKTIKQCRQTLAIMRDQIKRVMTGGEEQEGIP